MPKVSLKTMNISVIWGVITVDGILLAFILAPIPADQIAWLPVVTRVLAAMGAPLAILFLNSLLPSDWKASLVCWRLKHVLPGHRAFTVHGPADARVNMSALEKNIGAIPTEPREQNDAWMKLYRKTQDEITVSSAHRQFLLFRDLTSISAVLGLICVIGMPLLGIAWPVVGCVVFLFVVQFFATMVAARNNGRAFVTNVLSLHSTNRYR